MRHGSCSQKNPFRKDIDVRRQIFLPLLLILLYLPQAASARLGRWEAEEEGSFKGNVRSGRFRPFIEANSTRRA